MTATLMLPHSKVVRVRRSQRKGQGQGWKRHQSGLRWAVSPSPRRSDAHPWSHRPNLDSLAPSARCLSRREHHHRPLQRNPQRKPQRIWTRSRSRSRSLLGVKLAHLSLAQTRRHWPRRRRRHRQRKVEQPRRTRVPGGSRRGRRERRCRSRERRDKIRATKAPSLAHARRWTRRTIGTPRFCACARRGRLRARSTGASVGPLSQNGQRRTG